MESCIAKIEALLMENGIEFETSNSYINILNSSTMTRIHVREYLCGDIGTCISIEVQEFDGFGKQIYNKEFAQIGKAFLNRVSRNIG